MFSIDMKKEFSQKYLPEVYNLYQDKRKKDRYINPFIDESSIGEDL